VEHLDPTIQLASHVDAVVPIDGDPRRETKISWPGPKLPDKEQNIPLKANLNIAEGRVGHDTGQDRYEESIAGHIAKVCRQ